MTQRSPDLVRRALLVGAPALLATGCGVAAASSGAPGS